MLLLWQCLPVGTTAEKAEETWEITVINSCLSGRSGTENVHAKLSSAWEVLGENPIVMELHEKAGTERHSAHCLGF